MIDLLRYTFRGLALRLLLGPDFAATIADRERLVAQNNALQLLAAFEERRADEAEAALAQARAHLGKPIVRRAVIRRAE